MSNEELLKNYSKNLPVPEGFETYDGFDEKTYSRTFFRSPDCLREIVVTVEIRQRPDTDGSWDRPTSQVKENF